MEETKQLLRKRYIRARKALSAEARAAASARIAERIAALPEYQRASVVMVYSALPGEADLQPLVEHPASAGKTFVYPRCISDTEMAVLLPRAWRTGMYGIREPDASVSEEVAPEAVDFAVCPGVAFDDAKNRLGAGRGYYDRFLPKCVNAVVVMAAFEAQHAPSLPHTETDVPMDLVVTEKRVC